MGWLARGNLAAGIRAGARRRHCCGDAGVDHAARAMAEREDTRLLGLRGLFIEAQRADDPVSAVMIAEEALKLAPSSTWASHAVLGFRCARGDWSGALAILDNNLASGLIDKKAYRRQRGVLLTARALELENVDRDLSRESVIEAVKLAPTPATPTHRVAMLRAEIERIEHGDSGRARAWTLRAVRALHDPVWTADGYVSERWRPVSPVTGRLDAFKWQTPLAALPSDKHATVEASPFEQAMLAPQRQDEPPREPPAEAATPAAAQGKSPQAAPGAGPAPP